MAGSHTGIAPWLSTVFAILWGIWTFFGIPIIMFIKVFWWEDFPREYVSKPVAKMSFKKHCKQKMYRTDANPYFEYLVIKQLQDSKQYDNKTIYQIVESSMRTQGWESCIPAEYYGSLNSDNCFMHASPIIMLRHYAFIHTYKYDEDLRDAYIKYVYNREEWSTDPNVLHIFAEQVQAPLEYVYRE